MTTNATIFDKWLEKLTPTHSGVELFGEREGTRAAALNLMETLLANHFVGEEVVMKIGGYNLAAQVIKNSLPTNKRTQSGDLGELIASEYVDACTTYKVPFRKLRWKSDRQMPMHGNDIIAIGHDGTRHCVLKVESKSRVKFAAAAVTEAADGLDGHDGYPNPSTMAFVMKRLYEANRDAEAKIFETLQVANALSPSNVSHLIFALAGADPSALLAKVKKPANAGIKRSTAAVIIADHGSFVGMVYSRGPKP